MRVGQPHTSPLLQGHTHSHLYPFTLIPPPCCRVTLVLEFKAGKEDEEAAKRMDEVSCLGGGLRAFVCTVLPRGSEVLSGWGSGVLPEYRAYCLGIGCTAWGPGVLPGGLSAWGKAATKRVQGWWAPYRIVRLEDCAPWQPWAGLFWGVGPDGQGALLGRGEAEHGLGPGGCASARLLGVYCRRLIAWQEHAPS